jgi:sugar transferase (PEP-CTERM/EpsH1 system associated)
MKLLLLTQVLPYPPDSGPKIKTLNVIKYLAQHHKITLISFVRGDQSADIDHLRRYCEAVYPIPMVRHPLYDVIALARSLLTGQPWVILRDDRREMRRKIKQLLAQEPISIVHVDQLNMAQYAEHIPGVYKVLDTHNALWLLYQRIWQTMKPGPKKWLLGRDWRLLKRFEARICQKFDRVLAVSEEDRAALLEAVSQPLDITVIPITVDTDEVKPVTRSPDADHILYLGTMYWPPNIDGVYWFIREVLPLLLEKRPNLTFDVVGSRPPQGLLDLSRPETGIHVTGYVKDIAPYLEKAGMMIVPLRAGGGMRVKILEALAYGLPVVSTTIGCEGIVVENGRHILIADSPAEFARVILQLLDNRSLADELGRNGRNLIETTYDYRVALRTLDKIYSP